MSVFAPVERRRRIVTGGTEVVDADPRGLNLRMDPEFPRHFDNENAQWPTSPVGGWAVVGTVRKGKVLRAVTGNLGVIHLQDPNGATWLMVERKGDGYGFVRWNTKYLRPVAGPLLRP